MKGEFMKTDKWGVTLRRDVQEKLEGRVAPIVEYLGKQHEPCHWMISDLDATGPSGGKLTSRLNAKTTLSLSTGELIDILREDGQVIELDATLMKDDKECFKVLIRDGVSTDILGTGPRLSRSILGKHDDVDIGLFMW
jgi:hypothetical protein